jgi:hypothetical protein
MYGTLGAQPEKGGGKDEAVLSIWPLHSYILATGTVCLCQAAHACMYTVHRYRNAVQELYYVRFLYAPDPQNCARILSHVKPRVLADTLGLPSTILKSRVTLGFRN